MAMLAEPRRKQKLSINPQGTSWSNDENKFGQKMLERMGWSKGKGLGAKEDGRVDHVKINLKNDQKGVGCSKNYSDNWIAHQDDFNSLLESLNEGHSEDVEESNTEQVISLEKKSLSSKSRVHYGKFTRGKDLSSRSSHDLKCIFGKRANKPISGENTPTLESAESSGTEDLKVDVSHGFTTIKSTSNLQEYFAKKMAALKGQHAIDSGEDTSAGSRQKTNASDSILLSDHNNDEVKSSNKKKNKKSKRKDIENRNNVAVNIESEVLDEMDRDRKPENTTDNETVVDEFQEQVKKRKKMKKKKLELVLADETKQKKAKKRKREDDEPDVETNQKVVEKTSPKKKKKTKKNSVGQKFEEDAADETSSSVGTDETPVSSKKKQRTRVIPHLIKTVCKSFKGANVASIHGYDKTSMCEREMMRRIEDRHRLIIEHF